ncbi:MAG: hypothetical protein RLY58_1854 [Pseudomonadota bacterium]|jgi:hypothetical protein
MLNNQPTTTVEDRNLVATLWDNEECPYFDLLMFGNGCICSLEINSNGRGDISAKPWQWMAATSVPNIDNQNHRNEGFATLCSNDYPDFGFTLSGGECCASGENGFVAVTSSSSGALVWLAFFIASNPFESVSLQDGFVIAKTTSGYIYRFMLSEPQEIEVMRQGEI